MSPKSTMKQVEPRMRITSSPSLRRWNSSKLRHLSLPTDNGSPRRPPFVPLECGSPKRQPPLPKSVATTLMRPMTTTTPSTPKRRSSLGVSGDLDAPRTPVAGLVASFEKKKSKTDPEESLEVPRTPVSGLVASYEKKLKVGYDEETLCSTLASSACDDSDDTESITAASQHEIVLDLRRKLQQEKDTVSELKREISSAAVSNKDIIDAMQNKIRESEQKVTKLRQQVDAARETKDAPQKKVAARKEAFMLHHEMKSIQSVSSLDTKFCNIERELESFRSQVNALDAAWRRDGLLRQLGGQDTDKLLKCAGENGLLQASDDISKALERVARALEAIGQSLKLIGCIMASLCLISMILNPGCARP